MNWKEKGVFRGRYRNKLCFSRLESIDYNLNEIEDTIESSSLSVETTAPISTGADIRIPKRRCLIAILIAVALYGFLMGVLPEESSFLFPVDIAYNIIIGIIVVIWCHIDSKQWGVSISRKLSLMLFLIWIAAFPYYLSKTRKSMARFKSLGMALLFFAINYGVACATNALACIIYDMIYF